VSIARASLSAALAACALGAALAQPAPPQLPPLAHSALLAVDAAPGAAGLTLRVRRVTDKTPLVVNDLAVTIDGRSEPATARADGSWFVPRPAGAQDGGKTIDVTVGHDGIHEVLSGRLGASAAPSGAATSGSSSVMSSSRKQLLWWILNIAIVLIAAIAISRRMS
jgi:hypothetical protein